MHTNHLAYRRGLVHVSNPWQNASETSIIISIQAIIWNHTSHLSSSNMLPLFILDHREESRVRYARDLWLWTLARRGEDMVLLVEGVASIVVEFRRPAASGQSLIRHRLAGGRWRALRLKATLPWREESRTCCSRTKDMWGEDMTLLDEGGRRRARSH
jgi:hypothetical protein